MPFNGIFVFLLSTVGLFYPLASSIHCSSFHAFKRVETSKQKIEKSKQKASWRNCFRFDLEKSLKLEIIRFALPTKPLIIARRTTVVVYVSDFFTAGDRFSKHFAA